MLAVSDLRAQVLAMTKAAAQFTVPILRYTPPTKDGKPINTVIVLEVSLK